MKTGVLAAVIPAILLGSPDVEAKIISWTLDNLSFTDGTKTMTLNGGFTFDDTKKYSPAFSSIDITSDSGLQVFGAGATIGGCDPSTNGGSCPNGADFSFATSQFKVIVLYGGTLGSGATAVLTSADLINESGSGLCALQECSGTGGSLVQAVPLPATLPLLGLGLAGMGLAARRRAK